jgi:predicted  nucleic acid-binding Zn-ribbon protein
MTLNEFLSKAGNLLGLAEKSALATADEVAAAKNQIHKLEATNAELTERLASAIVQIDAHNASAELFRTEISALTAQVEQLKAEAKSSGERAMEIAAAQGIPADKIEGVAGSTDGQTDTLEAIQRAAALETDPVKKSALLRKSQNIRGIKFN